MRTRIASLSGLPFIAVGILAVAGRIAAAQTPAAAAPIPPAKPAVTEKAREKAVPAKMLFGAKALPSAGKSMAVGYYHRGCLSGGVELPINVDLVVTETEPGFAGDTQSGARKPATTETGLVVQVPIFVEQGDTIRVDTRTGEYQTRV